MDYLDTSALKILLINTNMINDKVVVGAMCVGRDVDMLNITIHNLLKYSDWVVLLLDNETPEVMQLVLDYQRKYYGKIWLRRSSFPHEIVRGPTKSLDHRHRWKAIKGYVRDEVFFHIRRILDLKSDKYSKIDILLFPDQDEIFTDYLPELLEKLWDSNKQGVSLKMVHVVNDMFTIKQDLMGPHFHIMKYTRELRGYPWQFFNMFHPITGSQIMKVNYYSVHLPYLTTSSRKFRDENWKKLRLDGAQLWTLDKSVVEMSPKEISDTFLRKPDKIFK